MLKPSWLTWMIAVGVLIVAKPLLVRLSPGVPGQDSAAIYQTIASAPEQASLPGDADLSCAALKAQLVAAGRGMSAAAAADLRRSGQESSQWGALVPEMVRGQRLLELAIARRCDWVSNPAALGLTGR